MMKTWTAICIGVIIGLLSGVGVAQITLVGTVQENKVEIKNAKEQIAETRKVFEDRLGNVIRLWEAQLNSERELIALVREQNRIIERTQPK